jgi:hypothetical protein
MRFSYSDESAATVASAVRLSDAQQVVARGRDLLACFDRHGIDPHPATSQAFPPFLAALYGAGFVMTDFDGPLFDRGPMSLLYTPGLAAPVAHAANLLTLRMFTHTLVRANRTDSSGGYPCFDEAYQSGGLRALIERLGELCAETEARHRTHMQDEY